MNSTGREDFVFIGIVDKIIAYNVFYSETVVSANRVLYVDLDVLGPTNLYRLTD